jgi:elongation factor P--(R)-beta-lysine ligase
MARRAREPLSPSDLAGAGAGRVRVAGRVARVDGTELDLADALAVVRVRGNAPFDLAPGDLAVLEGRLARGRVTEARVLERAPQTTPRGDGDIARFAWGGIGRGLVARARVLAALREYFAAERFVEVETPLRVAAPGVDSHVDALRAEGGYLITSPELHLKRLLVGGLPRVYQLGRVFRADELGALHQPEFTLLEWYRAFSGQDAIRRDTEAVVVTAAKAAGRRAELMAPDGRRIDVKPPFPVLSVRDAFRRHAGVRDAADLAATDEARFFELLVGKVEPALAALDRPIFLVDYPLSQAALARPSPADPDVAERFELYVGGVELSNGYGELTDPDEQSRRFAAERTRRKREGRRLYPLDRRFLAALREGMPPSGGNALGVDRLVMLCTGARSISDITAFPR